MDIKSLQARQGKVDLTATITEKEQPRTFEKFGKSGKVCNAKLQDASGTIKLTLWNEQADQVSEGDSVKIENGYVGEWQGELQLSTGKFGKLTVVGKGDAPEKKESAPKDDEEEDSFDNVDVEEESIE